MSESTSGYPFLVCRLCKIMDEELSKEDVLSRSGIRKENERSQTPDFERNLSNAWNREGFLVAEWVLIQEKNTLFDFMNQKLEDYPELERMIGKMLFNGEQIVYNPDLREIDIAMMFGFAKREGAAVVIANRIFESRLYNRFLVSEEWKQLCRQT